MDGGEVPLDTCAPLAVPLDVGKVAIAGEGAAGGWQVVEVIGAIAGRELDLVEGKGLEVFRGDKPGFVGTVEAAGKEEGFVGRRVGELF